MKTLLDKIWGLHAVCELPNDETLLYIDTHLIHEVTSPQAFSGLRDKNRTVFRPQNTFAVVDHNVPTVNQSLGIQNISDDDSRIQITTLESNRKEFNIPGYSMGDKENGIVHIVAPERGLTLPGMTIVCGDSHTSTHGAFGALGFGIGTTEVEHVLATQTLRIKKPKSLKITLTGEPSKWTSAKDVALHVIATIGASGGVGYVIEYCGDYITALSMEGRMTLCNMAIEAGARSGMVAVDQTTIDYLNKTANANAKYPILRSDPDAVYDKSVVIDIDGLEPRVTWGTSPDQVCGIHDRIPALASDSTKAEELKYKRVLEYMGMHSGEELLSLTIHKVFLGSCTNSRIEDLRLAASILKGKRIKVGLSMMVVPGSGAVARLAEEEGLKDIFVKAGCDWREPGCSMCLAMNEDKLLPEERSASTSNRNFEGRQGRGGRTHLVSPAVAAATAIKGRIAHPMEVL